MVRRYLIATLQERLDDGAALNAEPTEHRDHLGHVRRKGERRRREEKERRGEGEESEQVTSDRTTCQLQCRADRDDAHRCHCLTVVTAYRQETPTTERIYLALLRILNNRFVVYICRICDTLNPLCQMSNQRLPSPARGSYGTGRLWPHRIETVSI